MTEVSGEHHRGTLAVGVEDQCREQPLRVELQPAQFADETRGECIRAYDASASNRACGISFTPSRLSLPSCLPLPVCPVILLAVRA